MFDMAIVISYSPFTIATDTMLFSNQGTLEFQPLRILKLIVIGNPVRIVQDQA
jgi:hypothetical protein